MNRATIQKARSGAVYWLLTVSVVLQGACVSEESEEWAEEADLRPSMVDELEGAQPDQQQLGTLKSALTFSTPRFPISELPIEIMNVNSGRCLDVAGNGTGNNTNVQQFTCNAGRNQTWFLSVSGADSYHIRPGHIGNKNLDIAGGSLANNANVQIFDPVSDAQVFGLMLQSDGNYQIVSKKSEKCLDVVNASTANNANVQQFTCTSGLNQRWLLRHRLDPMNLIAKHSEKCLDVASGATGNNANAQQFTCAKATNQRWTPVQQVTVGGVTYYALVAEHSGKCLDVAGASTANNANVQQFTCNGGDNQKWSIQEESDGYVTIKNKTSGKCLDVAGVSAANNANVQQFTCNGGANQRWWWSFFDSRHVQIVQVANSAGQSRTIQSNTAIAQHVARANGVYGRYGLRLVYDSAVDKSNVNSDALFNLGSSSTFTCPDGSSGTPDECATRYAANWPDKVVVFSRPGGAYTSGASNHIVIGQMGSNATPVCTDVPDTQWLAHEFGHYMGLTHTFAFNNDDLLSDTRPDPVFDDCLAPHASTGTFNGTTVDTNNVMSYYYNDAVRITRMQASLTRAAAYQRGYLFF